MCPATMPTPDRNERPVSLARARRRRLRETGRAAARRPARAAVGTAHALRAMLRYWRAERATLRQGMISLTISAAGNIPTGLALGAMTDRLQELPGLFILIPAAIGMRGAIFGALGSRLGTSMNAGLLRFTMERTGVLSQNVYAAILQTFTTSLFLAAAARTITAATGLPSIPLWDYVAVSVLAGIMSSAFVLAVTIWLARVAAARDWDLDSVAAPIITFVGDLITLPALFLASFAATEGTTTLVIGATGAALCIGAAVASLRTKLPSARRILRESAITLMLAGIVDLFAGTVIEHRAERFFAFPALLVMLPSVLENAGALGGIVSSRLASKLHLGAIEPRLLPERLAALDISLAGPWALLNFGLVGASAHFVSRALGFASPGAGHMIGVSLLAGAMATVGAAVVAYATAVATFRFDLDPDNHGIAAVTSTMDLVGVVCVVGAVAILGVS